jgi:hypothetical protein
MKIELIKEEKFGDQDWYCIKIDGLSLAYEKTEEKANELYQMLINNPNLLKKREIILKSVEIVVPSEDTKTQE